MRAKQAYCAVAMLGVLLWGANESKAVVVVGGAGAPPVAANLWCTSTLDPNPVVYLPAGGADAIAQRATLLGQFAGIPGVQVVVGAALPGTLTIDTYAAYVKGDYGGATLVARYNDLVPGPSWVTPGPRWIQEINTNVPLGGAGSPYIDPRPGDDVKQGAAAELPYYWTDKEALGTYTNGATFDLRFSDSPGRSCEQPVDWEAELFLSSENNFTYPQADATHVITIHDGIRWGFELTPTIFKKFFVTVEDIIDTFFVGDVLDFSPGNGLLQYNGTTPLPPLHPGGVITNAPAHVPDGLGTLLDPNKGLLDNYLFDVNINGGLSHLTVFVNDLHDVTSPLETGAGGDIQFGVQVPIIAGLAQNLSMTINLSEDLIVVLDETKNARTDNALFIGQFSTFDPILAGFNVLGVRTLLAQHVGVHPGDGNVDKTVDAADYTIWANDFGLVGPALLADFNYNNIVDAADYTVWANNFGVVVPGPTSATATVPEPASWLMAAIGALGLALFRRSRRAGSR